MVIFLVVMHKTHKKSTKHMLSKSSFDAWPVHVSKYEHALFVFNIKNGQCEQHQHNQKLYMNSTNITIALMLQAAQ